jgi:hypothetical protein
MRASKTIGAALVAGILTVPAGIAGAQWPSSVAHEALQGCREGTGGKAPCACAVHYMERYYPRAPRSASQVQREERTALRACGL